MSVRYSELEDNLYDNGMSVEKLRRAITPAHRIAWDILADLRDRRGLRHCWDDIDSEIQDEIFSAWIDIAQAELDSQGVGE